MEIIEVILWKHKGFAHGFLVLSDCAEFDYKCTEFYHPEDEDGILWCDEEIGIEWPLIGMNKIVNNYLIFTLMRV